MVQRFSGKRIVIYVRRVFQSNKSKKPSISLDYQNILLMKSLLLTSISAFLLIFAISCRKDEIIINTQDNPPTPIVVNFTDSKIYGRVIDKEGNSVTDAQVTWGTENIQTDENGFFTLNSTVKERNAILKIEKEGYFSALQTLQTIEGVKVKTTVQLIERVLSGSLQSDTGGTISTNENGAIDFAANSFIDASGNPYDGSVNVFAYYLDPTIDDLKEIMPGNLTAVNAENTPQLLTSYGMMNVELEDDAGNPLQLSANARLTTPVPASLQDQAPESIPLWFFDTTEGTWREEGSATLEGNAYIGEVAHFTWWNCDIPQNFIYLEGQIDGGVNGTPVLSIKITNLSNGEFGIMDTYDKGNFAGPVPINQTLLLEVFSACGSLLHSEEIGPFSIDTELAAIPVDISDLNWFSFTGTLTDCDGNPSSNGYVVVQGVSSTISEVLTPNEEGTISATFADCEAGEAVYFGVDLTSMEASDNISITLTEDTQVGNIMACGNVVEESFDLTIAGVTSTWFPCTASITYGFEGEQTINVFTTHVQENGSVDYNITYFDWNNSGSGEPDWATGYEVSINGDAEVVYNFNSGFSGIINLEVLANGEVPGSLLHMIQTDVTVENSLDGSTTEGCTFEIKATIL